MQREWKRMGMTDNFEYRTAHPDEWQDAMGLAWRVFLKFVAPGYSGEGISSFRDFLTGLLTSIRSRESL